MTYKTLAKICAAISGSSIAYMFLVTYEGTYFGWTVFFIFLAFAILFHSLSEKEEEIAILRSPKEVNSSQDKNIKESEAVFTPTLHPGMEKQLGASPEKSGNKRLITLISPKGKTSEEVAREASQNFQKYEQVKTQVIFHRKNSSNPKNNDKN